MKKERPLESVSSHRKIVHTRCTWTAQEDTLLSKLCTVNNAKRWKLVAHAMAVDQPSWAAKKTPKQCRERWHTHLCPNILNAPWKIEEQSILFEEHKLFGNRWAKISSKLPGRTANAIKNYFFCRLRKLVRNVKNKIDEIKEIKTKQESLQLAYMLSHLYTQYINPDIKKEKDPLRLEGRNDQYITMLFAKDPCIIQYFGKYINFFLSKLTQEIYKEIMEQYPEFSEFITAKYSENTIIEAAPKMTPTGSQQITFSTKESMLNFKDSEKLVKPYIMLPAPNFIMKSIKGMTLDEKPVFNFLLYSSLVTSHELQDNFNLSMIIIMIDTPMKSSSIFSCSSNNRKGNV